MSLEIDRPAPLPSDIAEALATQGEAKWLDPHAAGIRYYPVVGSTNDVALRLAAEGAADGTTVIADAQTSGRGRAGRTWHSPPGVGLYLSMIVRPESRPAARLEWPRLITLAAGVGVADALLAATGLPVAIKWPNDLVIAPGGVVRGARKLAGILAEGYGSGGVDLVVLGCGINVGLSSYPEEIGARATSLEGELGRPVERGVVLAAILRSLSGAVARLRGGGAAGILDRWRELAVGATGARVRWGEGEGRRVGVTAGIDIEGALLVRHDGGQVALRAGEVEWL